MILHCNTLRHPLVHGGTQQRDRLLISLIPDQLKLDDRSVEELIAFAGRLSSHVRYWGAENQETGDWLPFWESDTTSLLAILASTDLDSPRTAFRSKEILYRRLKKREEMGTSKPGDQPSSAVMEELIKSTACGIYGLALTILGICQKTPQDHPLKQEIVNIISSTLQEPLYRLIQFHKAVDPAAIKQYEGFIGDNACAAPWGLKDKPAFECIDFILPYEYIDELWSLFLKFYKALSIILEKARKAFQSSLRTRHNHEPHIALFITFVHLFKHLQDELNSMVEKHLLFYYHDVLRLERRQLVPDKVHIVFELAAKQARHRLTAGTGLKAGADTNGVPMQYALTDELVISQAKLVARRNLYVKEETDENNKTVIKAYALPAADMKDGLEEEWPAGEKAWGALSGETVYQRLAYQYRRINDLMNRYDASPLAAVQEQSKILKKLEALQAFSGFSVSSTEFWLEDGLDRLISLDFTFSTNDASSLADKFFTEISTEKGLLKLNPYPDIMDNDVESTTGVPYALLSECRNFYDQISDAEKASVPPDEHFSLYNRIVRIRHSEDDPTIGTRQLYVIWLHPKFPAVLPVNDVTPPFIRFRSKETFTVEREIAKVEIYSYSGGVDLKTEGPMGGVLGRLEQPEQEGVFFRTTDLGTESKNQLVIVKDQYHDIFVRFRELFFKNPEYLRLSINNNQDATISTIGFLFEGQWLPVENNDDNVNYALNIENYKEHEGLLAPPAKFPFDEKEVNAGGWIKLEVDLTNGDLLSYLLDANLVEVSYRTKPFVLYKSGSESRLPGRHFFSYFNSLGDWQDLSGNGLNATPKVTMPEPRIPIGPKMFDRKKVPPAVAHGNLYLGFEQLIPGQTLSLLFKTAPGTGNPDHYAPEITWSYLADNQWAQLPPQYILKDTTLGMQETGIILFQIPEDINNNNTAVKGKDGRTDLSWLRASAEEKPLDMVLVDALPMLVDIHVNAAEAAFEDNNNTEDHLENGIPAATITALKFRDVNVKSVTQPYTSFQGRTSEELDEYGYITRIHERLRHKDRAVSAWDYERLLLQAYPQVAVLKCLPHSRRIYTARPGHVTVAAIPFPNKMTGNRIYYPIFEAGELTRMKQFLAKRNSYFVGGYGDPGFCCCDDGCQCDDGHDRLDVINARFEPVRIRICVRFYKGKDIPFYTKVLNEALKSFLAPWAKENKPLLFGTTISMTSMLQFLERLDYVDVVTSLRVKHFSSRQMGEEYEMMTDWSNTGEIRPFTAASVLTTYLDRLNEDNPNVIDHEINIIGDHERCACGACREDAEFEELQPNPPVFVPDDNVQPAPAGQPLDQLKEALTKAWGPRLRKSDSIVKAMEAALKTAVDDETLKGEIPATPQKGTAAKNAYRIVPVEKDGVVTGVKIGLALSAGKFENFQIDKP